MLCQFISSKDSADEGGDLLDPYYYDDDGNIQFYGPSGIPNDPRTREQLHWEDPEAYSRESIERSWNYVPKPESHWIMEECDLGKDCRRYGCRYTHKGTSDSKNSMGNISAPASAKEDNGEVDANNGVDVVDSHRKTKYKKQSGRSYQKLGKGEKKPKGGKKAKKKPFKTTRNPLKQQPCSVDPLWWHVGRFAGHRLILGTTLVDCLSIDPIRSVCRGQLGRRRDWHVS